MEEEAEAELKAAVQWYESKQQGLGLDFLNEVDAVFAIVASFPDRFPLAPLIPVRLGVRKCLTRRFPYGLYYVVLINEIRVLAVAHGKRRPGYWKDRVNRL